MDVDYKTDFVTVYGFNFDRAALDLGVSKQTVLRWYEQQPSPLAKRLLRIMARGYLPEHEPFTHWKISGTDIHTPSAVIPAAEIEFLYSYKWTARELAARHRNRPQHYRDLEDSVRRILQESESLEKKLKLIAQSGI